VKASHALCLFAAFSTAGVAQPTPPTRPTKPTLPSSGLLGMVLQPYDADKEETIKGMVASVSELASGPETLVCLAVMVDGKECQLTLAPPSFLKENNASFAKNDEITIKGYKTQNLRGATIRAKEVIKGEKTLVLLDKDGKSAWGPKQEKDQTGVRTGLLR
jgi:phosphatidylserine decarboxylase